MEDSTPSRDYCCRLLFDHTNDALFIENGKEEILDVNHSACELVGYSPEELTRMRAIDIQAPECRGKPPGILDPESPTHITKPFESVFLHKDGSRIPVEITNSRLACNDLILKIVHDVTARKQAEEALRRSEAKFRNLTDFAPISISILRPDRFVYVNKAWEKLIGYSHVEAVSMSPLDVVHPEMREMVMQRAESRLKGETVPDRYRLKIITKSGAVKWGDFMATLIDLEGKPAILTVVNDISEQITTREALAASEQQYREIFENAPLGIFRSTEAGRFDDLNPALARMMGFQSPRQAIEAIHNIAEQVFVDSDLRKEIIAVCAAGDGYHVSDVLYRRASGEKWLGKLHMREIKGRPAGQRLFEGFVEDITEKHIAETALLDEKERLNVTLRSIGDAVITADRQGRVTLMNPVAEKLTGWREKEALGKPLERVFQVVNEHSREPCKSPFEAVIDSGEVAVPAKDTLLISRSGDEHMIADSGAPILDANRQIIGVVLVFRDISATQRMEAEMLKAEKLQSLGVLAGGIAHDFNNFLAGIVGNVSLAKLDVPQSDPLFPLLQEMEKAAMRAKNLTQQLLTFSKGGEPVKTVVDLGQIARETAAFAMRGSKALCQFDFADDLWMSKVDGGQMAQAIHNLVINADQAMPEGGTVTIRGRNMSLGPDNPLALAPGNYVCLGVEDEGTGIPTAFLKKVFDPYFTTKQKGSGLGLAVAYSVIEKHGGKLTVSSDLSMGTIFEMYLPAMTETLVEKISDRDTILTGAGRILVMDDEALVRKLARAMLTKLGYTVTLAEDGAQALDIYARAMASNQPFDAVILDLTVSGGMGGKETIQRLRELNENVKAIVSSGYSNDPVVSQFSKYGFKAAVKKPYLVHEMAQTIHSLIAGTDSK